MPADETALFDLEDKLLTVWDEMWNAYEEAGGGVPSMALINIGEKLHKLISSRLRMKLGPVFDEDNPEASLIMLERMKQQLIKQVAQRQRLQMISS